SPTPRPPFDGHPPLRRRDGPPGRPATDSGGARWLYYIRAGAPLRLGAGGAGVGPTQGHDHEDRNMGLGSRLTLTLPRVRRLAPAGGGRSGVGQGRNCEDVGLAPGLVVPWRCQGLRERNRSRTGLSGRRGLAWARGGRESDDRGSTVFRHARP